MKQETDFIPCGDGVEPESVLLRREKVNRYGSVPGLDDEELADPDELERQLTLQEWGPVLALPAGRTGGFRPEFDEDGVRCDAFATVDFDRYSRGFDKTQYKTDKLREERNNVLIMLGMVEARVPGVAWAHVLKLLRMGVIELDHIVDGDILMIARLSRRAERLQEEIAGLDAAREARERRAVEAMLARWS